MLTPATKTGRWKPSGGHVRRVVDDADEEVGREERAEEHDLRRDEQEHPEHARVDARAGVRGRRAVVVVRSASRVRTQARPARGSGSTVDVLDRQAGRVRSRCDDVLAQPARSAWPGNVETMISSTRSSWTACIAAVYGSGWAIWPCASIPAPRSAASARRSRRSASGCAGHRRVALRADRSGSGRRAGRARLDPRRAAASPITVSFAITSTFASPPSAREVDDDVLDRDRRPRPSDPLDDVAAQPAGASTRGCVETMISSTGGSSCASASRTASTGSARRRSRRRRFPPRAAASSVLSSRRRGGRAARVLVDDVALARRVHGADDRDLSSAPSPLRPPRSAPGPRPSRSRRRAGGSIASPAPRRRSARRGRR